MQKISFFAFVGFFLAFSAQAEERIDLQWSVCESDSRLVAARLGVEGEPKEGSITYFDSLPVSYIDKGLTFRIRGWKAESSLESSVKMRFPNYVADAPGECEWDRYGAQETYTCEVAAGEISPEDPWVPSLRQYAESFSPIAWKELHTFGPYTSLTWRTRIGDYKVQFDTVILPGGLSPASEISVKVPYSRKDEVYDQLTAEFRAREVKLCDRQESKTMKLFRLLELK
jgi:hypothetical protein